MNKATVSDIVKIMETIAPSELAEEWDNIGLMAGKLDWPVSSIRVALDPTIDVVENSKEFDLVVTHHPLIFNPLKNVDFSSPIGSVIYAAALNKTAVFSAHTNLDSASGGVNDVLASRIGLENIDGLRVGNRADKYKLVVFAPIDSEQNVLDAVFKTKAGRIGAYSCCTYRTIGKGTFKPDSEAKPYIGSVGEVSHVDELRIEVIVDGRNLKQTIRRINAAHPYETMAYDIYPLGDAGIRPGIGRVGELSKPMELCEFAAHIRDRLGLENVKVAGNPGLSVKKAAVCSGSGSSLMNSFFSSGAQVYITGDLRFHDAKSCLAKGLGLIDIGHFASEIIIVKDLAGRLAKAAADAGWDVVVDGYGLEREPFTVI